MTKWKQTLDQITSNPKQLFLLDGLGALASAFGLGVVLVQLEAYIGMPRNILYFLAAIAVLFAIYSLSRHFFLPTNWKPYLKAIMTANLLYCCLTMALVVYYYSSLSFLGVVYFVLEVAIIVGLVVGVERKALI